MLFKCPLCGFRCMGVTKNQCLLVLSIKYAITTRVHYRLKIYYLNGPLNEPTCTALRLCRLFVGNAILTNASAEKFGNCLRATESPETREEDNTHNKLRTKYFPHINTIRNNFLIFSPKQAAQIGLSVHLQSSLVRIDPAHNKFNMVSVRVYQKSDKSANEL